MKILICDIDGVIADCTHRLGFIQGKRKNWDKFFAACVDDDPIEHVIGFINDIVNVRNVEWIEVVYITGRPERTREMTDGWLRHHGLPRPKLLLMRGDTDRREDYIVKSELYEKYVAPTKYGYFVTAVLEDRDQVVEMWRAKGLLCLQPKRGDY